jgi:pimeloyl-ACP methyl ester carboxylesterase
VSTAARAIFDDPLRAACPATCPRLGNEAGIGLEHRFVEANGVRFHVVEAGTGPLVLLLHGFPEFWYGWRDQIPALASQFRVVAPDLRGYNLSEKPDSGYDFDALINDGPALIRALGADRAHVVGHDWGGVLAWGAAMHHPDRVDRLAILNAPHPAAYFRELERNLTQRLKAWYIVLFQVPRLAEWLLTQGHGRGVTEILRTSTVDPRAFTATDLAAYRRAISRPGAASATLAYYRALWSTRPERLSALVRVVQAPTLLIWGMQDRALVPELTSELEGWVPNLRVERLPDAGHWVQHERPEQVNRLLLSHLGSGC